VIRVRVDDFPHTKAEPGHTLAAFQEFDRCLRESIGGRRYLLGVIPGRCSVDDIVFLRNHTDCVVGMHGTDHDEERLTRNGGNQFEPYLTVAQIAQQLYDHHEALQNAVGRRVQVYMPPRNVINHRTVSVLGDCGFEAFTTGPETDSWAIVHPRSLYSEKPFEYGRSDELLARDNAVEKLIAKTAAGGNSVLTLHWTWETNIGLQHMVKFLTQIPRELFASFDE
jgi:peptidoglycan/xylan/chitin deacetylase (PgdA/CDA1 family)